MKTRAKCPWYEMPIWFQHLLVLLLVAGCLSLVGWQAIQTLRGRKSAIGKCCAKGCDTGSAKPQAALKTSKVHFMPVEMLTRRK